MKERNLQVAWQIFKEAKNILQSIIIRSLSLKSFNIPAKTLNECTTILFPKQGQYRK